MKYIVLQTADGRKMPIIFPDILVHADVAKALTQHAARQTTRLGDQVPVVCSAGFVTLEAAVHGESESLGGIKCNQLDAYRIMFGDAIAFMPDDQVEKLLANLHQSGSVSAPVMPSVAKKHR